MLFVILFSLIAADIPYDDIVHLRWVDPDNEPLSYEEYAADIDLDAPYAIMETSNSPLPDAPRLLIITDSSLYSGVSSVIENTFIPQLESEGYSVWNITVSGGTPDNLRNTILNYYNNHQIDGVFLIGDLPTAWYHVDNDYGQYGPADFPCDLVYTALSGTFTDTNYDGKYDTYSGNIAPVINLGRLKPAEVSVYLGKTQAQLVNSYLNRDVSYRTGGIPLDDKALSYIDDDWSAWGYSWGSCVRLAYPSTNMVYNDTTTWSTDYMDRWDDDYEHIMVCVHSSPTFHQFHRPSSPSYGYVNYNDIVSQQPQTHFFNLFACSNCNFEETNCMGSDYIFHDGGDGLISIGSAKTGGMLGFDDFYTPLSNGKAWAESLRLWFGDVGIYDVYWHFGMTCLGDPTLAISRYVGVDSVDLLAQESGGSAILSWWGDSSVTYNLYRTPVGMAVKDLTASKLAPLNELPISGRDMISFRDAQVQAGNTNTWYLAKIDATGSEHLVGNTTMGMSSAVIAFTMGDPYPNPATSTLTCRISVAEADALDLSLYDLSGRLVQTQHLTATLGNTDAVLDVSMLATGVYTLRASSGGADAVRRVVVVR